MLPICRLWDFYDRSAKPLLDGLRDPPKRLAMSPDGTSLASMSEFRAQDLRSVRAL